MLQAESAPQHRMQPTAPVVARAEADAGRWAVTGQYSGGFFGRPAPKPVSSESEGEAEGKNVTNRRIGEQAIRQVWIWRRHV